MPIQKIAVAGATGMIGRPVTRALLEAGYDVTLLTRSPERAERVFPGTPAVEVDLLDGPSVRAALAGQDAVYLSLSVPPNEPRQAPHAETDGLRHVLASARAHGLQRVALLSSLVQRYQGTDGFHWWVFDVKQEAVRLLKASGLPYTIFYASTFMDNFVDKYRQGTRLLVVGDSRQPMYFVAGSDYGAQVARSFRVVPEGEPREYVVQGSEAYLDHEAAYLFARHSPEPIRVTRVPLGLLKLLGKVLRPARYGAHIVEALNNYPETFEAETTWAELGRPETTIEAFARTAEHT